MILSPTSLPPYLRFRVRLAQQAMLQFVASFKSSLEYILLGFGQVLVGLVACLALPGLFAATRPWPQALGLFAGQALIASAPVWLLRKRLLPQQVLQWCRPLPIPARWQWGANIAVAGMIIVPLSLAYALSTAIWLFQWPDWLQPVAPQALLLTAGSLLLGWIISTLVLARRCRMPAAARLDPDRPLPGPYAPRLPASAGTPPAIRRARTALYHWRQLFWLPFWRAENLVGIQQTVLLLGAVLGIGVWLWHPAVVPPALWGFNAAILLMLLTDRGDKAVTEQIALLRPVAAAWPVRIERLFRFARWSALLPGLAVMAWFALLTLGHLGRANSAGYSTTVATVWLCFAGVAQAAVVMLRRLSVRGRVGLVISAIIILTAIGSELWN
ncbi:hypothetical protein GTP81_28170 [Rugamonas sp. FT107W]|uniref:Uncharacterized protein n=1 Tax=Duganella vulcania TaxID=2692166 RepID=A0A845HT61_9BURK|nr:hypothetical protein [Duganella vulcania]MYN20623.1 hypothetical protein [Duganella vulcania]